MWKACKDVIHQKERFAILTHVNPDGDALGSSVAFAELLKLLGKEGVIVLDAPAPKKFDFLSNYHTLNEFDPKLLKESWDAIVVLDLNRPDRLGRCEAFLELKGPEHLCIDHHALVKEPFTENLVLDATASSVGAMLYSLYRELGLELSDVAAMSLYVSVLSDTGGFATSTTDRKSHKIADECLKQGVSPSAIYEQLFQQLPLEDMKLCAQVLARTESYYEGQLVLEELSLEDVQSVPGASGDLEALQQMNRMIGGVTAVAILKQLAADEWRLSIRARKDLDLGRAVSAFGGGGHSRAAGASLEGSLAEVKQKVIGMFEPLLS